MDRRARPDDENAPDIVSCFDPQAPTDFDALLDYSRAEIEAGRIAEGMSTLYIGLYGHRRSMARSAWELVAARARTEHPLRPLVDQSPLTRRAYEKPRGYAGDAKLIDLIYGSGDSPRGLTELGEEIYAWERRSPGCRSVRARRDMLAGTIDFVSTTVRHPRILSIACGHLREALMVDALKRGTIGEFVALDQDAESLNVVRNYGFPALTIEHRSVKDVLLKRNDYRDFDFVYAAGLFDYLPDNVGRALSTAMFRMLRPGGRCLVANFAPDMLDIGYMDVFMDWRLIYRTEAELAALTEQFVDNDVFSRRMFRDPHDCIVYCELVRA